MNDKLRAAAHAVAELLADAWIAELEAVSQAPDLGDVASPTSKYPSGNRHEPPVPNDGPPDVTTRTA